MQKKTHYLLVGVVALGIVAIVITRYFNANPEPGPSAATTGQNADSPAVAGDVQRLLSTNACLGCHAVDRKLVGPAFRDVAARYKGDAQAVGKLSISIRKGGAERWGDAAMPPTPNLSEEQARQLAAFILQQ